MAHRNKKKKKQKGLKRGDLIALILKAFRQNPKSELNYKQIAGQVGIIDTHNRKLINRILCELAYDGRLKETRPGKFILIKDNKIATGIVDFSSSGAAYVIVEGMDRDVYIKERYTNKALNKDEVEIEISRGKGRPEGRITNIVKRNKMEFVGIIEISARYAFVVADNPKIHVDFFVPLDKVNHAKDGEKVVVRISDWPDKADSPYAEVIEILGMPGDMSVEMGSILLEHGFATSFPESVEAAAKELDTTITKDEIAKRKDFRDITTFTIDPRDAKDFDDALSYRVLENGNYEVGIHIADVSHYVKPGSIIDKEAYDRATSIYLVDRVIPMLPEMLSNGVCSLRPQEEKLCFAAVFEMNEKAEILDSWFGRTVIYSDRRFVYEEVQEILEGGEGDFKEELLKLDKLAKILREKRMGEGSISFNKIEVRFELDEDKKPTGVYLKEQKDANKLIEDFMLLANRKVAEHVGKRQAKDVKTFVYRIHDKPDPVKLATFNTFIGKFGYNINMKTPKSTASSMNNLLAGVEGKGEQGMIETLAIRTMSKAVYSTDNVGHYGLSFQHYSHFTSPIRRYPDVIVHRLLERYLDGGKSAEKQVIEDQCTHTSEMERQAAQAERDSIKFYQVKLLEDKIGEEFDGVISGVTEWGIFVEINENKCEGLVRYNSIEGDHFIFDEDNYRAVGHKTKKEFQLGQAVRIQVKRADLMKKQLDFIIVDSVD